MARKIVLTSGKGGVGKTTICANLGVQLASLGFRTVLVDVDIGLNNLDVVMGLEKKVVFDITDVIMGKCRAKQALIEDDRFQNLFLLPSSHYSGKAKILGEHVRSVLNMLDSSFDYILIDCPAGVDAGFHRAVFSANEAIVVVTPHLSSLRDASKVIGLLSEYDITSKGLVINRMRGDLLANGEMLRVEDVVRAMHIPLYGVIPRKQRRTSQLFIYEGVHDGYTGSVPVTHAINMYNRVVGDWKYGLGTVEAANRKAAVYADLVSEDEIIRLLTLRNNPKANPEEKIGDRQILLRREASNTRLVIFEGTHEMLPCALDLIPVGR